MNRYIIRFELPDGTLIACANADGENPVAAILNVSNRPGFMELVEKYTNVMCFTVLHSTLGFEQFAKDINFTRPEINKALGWSITGDKMQ